MQKEQPNPRVKIILLRSQNSKGDVSKGECVTCLKRKYFSLPGQTQYQEYLVSQEDSLYSLGKVSASPLPPAPIYGYLLLSRASL